MGRQNSSHQIRHGSGPAQPPNVTGKVRPDRRQDRYCGTHEEGSYKGTVVCGRCHAVWQNKRWYFDEAMYTELSQRPDVETVVCPADMQIEKEEYDGYVVLRSPLIPKNEEAVLGLIYNTEKALQANNPLARIAKLSLSGETIEVHTITPFLAQRIGKEFSKAYHGQLEMKPSDGERFIRVSWYRE